MKNVPQLGAHMSIAGGYWRCVELAARAGCDCVQLFTKNNAQWRAKPISDDDVSRFRNALAQLRIRHPLSHASYLINLASPDSELRRKSVRGMIVELERACQLGIPYVVVHPGASTTSSAEQGIRQAAKSLNEVLRSTRGVPVSCLLENTSGAGSCLGGDFSELSRIIDRVREPERVGVCLDTCHAFAVGYPLAPKPAYLATIRQLNRTVGLARVRAVHLNDSRGALGSRLDRHAHIGRGAIGLEGFRLLLSDRRFRRVPMYLETPKGVEAGRDLDRINLETLRNLVVPPPRRRRSGPCPSTAGAIGER